MYETFELTKANEVIFHYSMLTRRILHFAERTMRKCLFGEDGQLKSTCREEMCQLRKCPDGQWAKQIPGTCCGYECVDLGTLFYKNSWLFCCSWQGFQNHIAIIVLKKDHSSPTGKTDICMSNELSTWVFLSLVCCQWQMR